MIMDVAVPATFATGPCRALTFAASPPEGRSDSILPMKGNARAPSKRVFEVEI